MLRLIGSALIVAWLLVATVILLAWIRLEAARRRSRSMSPQKGEVWLQDGKPLYIKDTAKHGVLLLAPTPGGEPHVWWDTWHDWKERCRNRVVLRSAVSVVRDAE